MTEYLPLIVFLPALGAAIAITCRGRAAGIAGYVALLFSIVNLYFAVTLFGTDLTYRLLLGPFGLELSFRLYHFSGFIVAAAAGFTFLVTLYSLASMTKTPRRNQFYSYVLLTLMMVNGAVLSDNLLVMFFFWEGLLVTLFALIAIGTGKAFQTAVKSFMIVGFSDLCMMLGIILAANIAGTYEISSMKLELTEAGPIAAFILLMIGAIAKAGSVPFHTWIPDAAESAFLPFMALLPAALEKLLGIYFLSRLCMDIFSITPGSIISMGLMTVGAITIVSAVLMALIQKDYKRLLSFHAISQVGYMVLGIGTGLPVGIAGGIFHMINHAMYKSCLFLTGGSVERQAGSTNLEKLGGLARSMPITFGCFVVAAASISGVPPFNGFFSKELVYEAALEIHPLFYIAAIVGSFFTAASFLKLGHAVYFGVHREGDGSVKEAPLVMLIPMITIALLCVFFGVFNYVPLEFLVGPSLKQGMLEGVHLVGLPGNTMLIIVTVLVIAGAIINHLMGAHASGSGLHAVDHIQQSPLLSWALSSEAEKEMDPYEAGKKFLRWFSEILLWIDRKVDAFYEVIAVSMAKGVGAFLGRFQNGDFGLYIIWTLLAVFLTIMFALQ